MVLQFRHKNMPHKNKKKFIDKKKAVTFQLVHRSQKDPLAADEGAPQRILVPVQGGWEEHQPAGETPEEKETRISQQRLYGVGFDDDYDYMQHLKEPDRPMAVLVPKSAGVTLDELPEESDMDEHNEMTEIFKDGDNPVSFKIPSVVFASKQEEEVGMLHRAIPPVGPQVEWDPDVVAAMDEDFDFADPDNIIEDDFVLQATEEEPGHGQEEEEQYSEDSDMEGSSGCYGSMESDDDMFAEEETKSRFTQYSMTSSVLRRNEHLTLLDDQFEKFYETYDDENIGDLPQVEIDGAFPVDNLAQEDALKRLLGVDDHPSENPRSDSKVEAKRLVRIEELEESGDSDAEDKMVEITKEVPSEKWDCESILSTYSNIYNHPKIIADPPKVIKLSKKTGIPLESLPTRGLTKKQLTALDRENEEIERSERFHTVSESSNVTSTASNVRRKGETREEKSARKQAVREQRKERRAEKKATKIAFKQEKTRQSKELINLQQNLNGIRIS